MRTKRRTQVYSLLMALAAWSGLAGTPVAVSLADGGEATGLGAPSIAIASGSGVVAAGAGTFTPPGVINLNVPGTVQQALLYWAGEHSIGTGDDTIDVDFSGNAQVVVGTLIGGETFFFNFMGDVYVSTYRADVTPFVSAGGNTLTITGMDFDEGSLGAGLLVIYDDGTSAAIELRDGQDLAFAFFAPPLDATVPQTFAVTPAAVDRTGEMLIIAGDVEAGRPNRIRIDVPGAGTTDIDNLLNSTDGPDWDTQTIAVDIPAGADSVTVEAISFVDGTGVLPASLAWITSALTIADEPVEELDCRVTGGGHDTFDGHRYTFGTQGGAPDRFHGEWTHHEQQGPDGQQFVFHAGTSSAPADTEVHIVACSDPGYCRQARPAPAKQIDLEGVGSFRNLRKPTPDLANVVPGETLHWVTIHVEDLGEPGSHDEGPECPADGSDGQIAPCSCPDFYRFTIYEGVMPGEQPNTTDVIYEVFGYIDGGNFQIHPSIGG